MQGVWGCQFRGVLLTSKFVKLNSPLKKISFETSEKETYLPQIPGCISYLIPTLPLHFKNKRYFIKYIYIGTQMFVKACPVIWCIWLGYSCPLAMVLSFCHHWQFGWLPVVGKKVLETMNELALYFFQDVDAWWMTNGGVCGSSQISQ